MVPDTQSRLETAVSELHSLLVGAVQQACLLLWADRLNKTSCTAG